MDFTDIYKKNHAKTKEYNFFSAPDGTFSKTDKNMINRYKKIEIIPCTTSKAGWYSIRNQSIKQTNKQKKAHIHKEAV